jgi:large subunit ribosomal protein L30
VDDNPHYLGMLQKAKDYIAYGQVDAKTLATILEKRGELDGGSRLTIDYLKKHGKVKSFQEFAEKLIEGKKKLNDIPGLKRVFRMHPPRRGHRGILKSFQVGGELGYHGEAINELLIKMR